MTNRYLPAALRRALEKTAKDARVVAEDGARDAIRRLGIADSKAPAYLRDDEKELRRRLRAHARALGDVFDKNDETQGTKRLVEAAAYAHWHRMLFARFLAERGLLRNPEYDVPVSLEDCRELAEAEGLPVAVDGADPEADVLYEALPDEDIDPDDVGVAVGDDEPEEVAEPEWDSVVAADGLAVPEADPDAEDVAEKEPYPLAVCEPVAVAVAEAVCVAVGLPVRDWPADAEAELEGVAAEETD